MLSITPDELRRWRAEVELAVELRDQEFGTYKLQRPGTLATSTGAGRNLEAFEQGAREDTEGLPTAPLNLVFPIIRTILPTLFYQNPRANALPGSRQEEAEEDAFYVSELLNRDLRDPDFRFKETGNLTVFDATVLGAGVLKIGYATEFGPDILPTKAETRQGFRERLKQQVSNAMTAIGLPPLVKPQDPEPEQVQPDLTIRAESPYVQWLSPFDFVIDPRARDLTDARWVGQCIRRTVAEVKRDRRYGQAKQDLVGDPIEEPRIPDSFIEEFQTVEVWEVHYKNLDAPTGITTLTFAKTQVMTKALMHDHNVYDIGGWQYEWLTPNKHGHRLWPISALSVCRPLLDRINSAFDAVLEQLDKFVAKVAINERVGKLGKLSLETAAIGGVIPVDGQEDVRSAIAVISMNQFNAEVTRFLDYCVDFIILIVGLTRAQLTGLTTAQTATEAQIGQGGSNLRRTDESNIVGDFLNRVVTKLWRVKAQFQDFTEQDLVQQTGIPNPATGMETTSWYPPIDQTRNQRLKSTRFSSHIELGSIQKPNIEIVRAQLEQFFRALMEPAVTQGLALEGKRISVEEAIRQWTRYFAEYGMTRLERIIVPVKDEGMRQWLMAFGETPSRINGNQGLAGSVPNTADLIAKNAGERGQGVPLV